MGKRIVVVEKNGKSTIHPRTDEPRRLEFQHTPGFVNSTIWATTPRVRPAGPDEDPALTLETFHPEPGGTVFITMTFPPDEVFTSPDYNPALAGPELVQSTPGIAERFEKDGFHRTDTVDYVIVLDGELVAEVDDGEVTLSTGDILIQNGTRHSWHNRSGKPVTIAVVLIGIH